MFRKKLPTVAAIVEKARGFFTADSGGRNRVQAGRSALEANLSAARALAPMAAGEFAADEACQSGIKRAYAMLDQPHLSDVLLAWFASQSFIGHQVAAVIAQHWLVRKACFMPARDAIRNGFIITSDSGDELDARMVQLFAKADERYKLNERLLDFVGMGRVYGIRLCLFKVKTANPQTYYENPFNPDAVTPGSYEGMVLVDPYWTSPILDQAASSDPASPHFYEPTWWQINGQKYHRSHFAIFRNGEIADILKPVYQYGGVPVPQMIAERVYCAERTANEAPQLAMTKRTTVLQVNGAEFAANEDKAQAQLERWVAYRDNFGVKVVDKEGEGIEQFDTALTDLDDVIMSQYQIVAAVAGVPATKLMGTTPKGFNATGEYDEKNYHEELQSLQTHDLTPLVERHHDLVMRSTIMPKMGIAEPVSTVTVWEPLDSPGEKEQADAQLAEAQRDKALVETGALDGQDVRDRLRKNRMSGYYGIASAAPEEVPEPITIAEPGATVPVGDAAIDPIRIVTNQRYIDPDIVQAKMIDRDFDVQVSPCFVDSDGTRYRIVIDGHHSLAAAKLAGVAPNFIEGDYAGSDYTPVDSMGVPMTGI